MLLWAAEVTGFSHGRHLQEGPHHLQCCLQHWMSLGSRRWGSSCLAEAFLLQGFRGNPDSHPEVMPAAGELLPA